MGVDEGRWVVAEVNEGRVLTFQLSEEVTGRRLGDGSEEKVWNPDLCR